MKHPLTRIPDDLRAALFVFLFILTITLMVALNSLGQPLQTDAAPAGIISYEFAGDVDTAQEILDSMGRFFSLDALLDQMVQF